MVRTGQDCAQQDVSRQSVRTWSATKGGLALKINRDCSNTCSEQSSSPTYTTLELPKAVKTLIYKLRGSVSLNIMLIEINLDKRYHRKSRSMRSYMRVQFLTLEHTPYSPSEWCNTNFFFCFRNRERGLCLSVQTRRRRKKAQLTRFYINTKINGTSVLGLKSNTTVACLFFLSRVTLSRCRYLNISQPPHITRSTVTDTLQLLCDTAKEPSHIPYFSCI